MTGEAERYSTDEPPHAEFNESGYHSRGKQIMSHHGIFIGRQSVGGKVLLIVGIYLVGNFRAGLRSTHLKH